MTSESNILCGQRDEVCDFCLGVNWFGAGPEGDLWVNVVFFDWIGLLYLI